MQTEITAIKQITDIKEARLAFGHLLGLDSPVSEDVLVTAIEDEDYARNLLLSRRDPQLLSMLLQQHEAAVPDDQTAQHTGHHYSSLELIGKATKALIGWGMTGFATVEDAVYHKRLSACEGCDQLEQPADKLIYKISLKKGEDKRTCKECGCVVARKARLINDTCPMPDAANPGLNRWGESTLKKEKNIALNN